MIAYAGAVTCNSATLFGQTNHAGRGCALEHVTCPSVQTRGVLVTCTTHIHPLNLSDVQVDVSGAQDGA
ncbi:hypothetical protein PanWU01x14_090710 [Parasponia andersonii]|uniref:Uncharacterized protein n=1 Tax=Parasponia andersonii TaxID=3476 RepID=A0A2P5D724_PARAD|nr:hypothetical protein PanWU01x14_090710 [Parasponia andersonii]